jgi:hypothetical protein
MFLSLKALKSIAALVLHSEKYATVEISIFITYTSNILGIFFTGEQCCALSLSICNKIVMFLNQK